MKHFLLLLTCLSYSIVWSQDPYIITVQTDIPGTTNASSFGFFTSPFGNCEVDWDNDGVYDEFNLSGTFSHDYGTPGTYTIRVKGYHPALRATSGDAPKIISLDQWGTSDWGANLDGAFSNAVNMVYNATDAPILTDVKSLLGVFEFCTFTADLSDWDVSDVENFELMFYSNAVFNGDISNWDMGSATSLNFMFANATSFNKDISNWNTENVTSFFGMFDNAPAFNQDISDWDVSSSTDFRLMFRRATVFNQDLSSWDVSNCTSFEGMFELAVAFNGDISTWDVSSAMNMYKMFSAAIAFDRDISGWNVSKVTFFRDMLSYAQSFNQNLSAWDFTSATNMQAMLTRTAIDLNNYDLLLHSLANQNVNSGLTFGVSTLQYCESEDDRDFLINNKAWTFTGDSYTDECLQPDIFDLAVRTTVNPAFPGPHYETALVDFDITVFNQGEIDAYNIGIKGFFLAGLSLADPDWTNNTLDNPIPFIAAGDSATVQITLEVVLNSAGFFVRYDAEIISADDDSDPSNTPPTDIDSTPGDYSAQTPFTEDENIDNTAGLDDQDLGGFMVSVGTAEICDNNIDDDGDGDIDCADSNCQSICDYECWDLNQNGMVDDPEEDTNGDGVVNDYDCQMDCSNMEAFCQDATIYLGEDGTITLNASDVFVGITQGCLAINGTLSQSVFNCDHIGDNVITVTANDNQGNSATCESTVSVLDTIPPELICESIVIELDDTELATIDINDLVLEASDNCSIYSFILGRSQFTCQDVTSTFNEGFTIEEDTIMNTQNNFINEIIVHDDFIYLTKRPSDEILIYDLQGNFQSSFGVSGNGVGEIGEPANVAFASNGNIYVSDRSWNDKILVYDANHQFQFEFATPAVENIAIHNDTIYAAHDDDNKISTYRLDGSLITDLITITNPSGLYLANNKVYAIDISSNAMAKVYTIDGSLLQTINIGGWANDISADECGNIYIARWNASAHDIYDENGNLILNSNIALLSITNVDGFVYGVSITGEIYRFEISCGNTIGVGTYINTVTYTDSSGNESYCNPAITILDPHNTCICPLYLDVNDVPIPSDVYRSELTITSQGEVLSSENVNFESLKITLEEGFKVQPGATFRAWINPCQD